jgi:ferrous iron transport protein B
VIEARPGRSAAASIPPRTGPPLVAVAGNPNTGKTTLFNRLTGSDQKVGNYPGITVERALGAMELPDIGKVRVMDVPGTYSLSARSEEEEIAVRAIAGLPPYEMPDCVLIVVDATQLTRNLYFVLQVLETDVPCVIALNMCDMLAASGERIDVVELARVLEVPVVPISALRGKGLDELRAKIAGVLADPRRGRPGSRWRATEPALQEDVRAVAATLPPDWTRTSEQRRDALALWALLSIEDHDELRTVPRELRECVLARRALAAKNGRQIDSEIIAGRYGWIDRHAARFLVAEKHERKSPSERIDAVLLNPALGFFIFLVVMGTVFQSLFSWSDPLISVIESACDGLGSLVTHVLPAGIVQEFVVDGLIAGLGSVIVFLPQILLLFFFIGLMEDTGYMARVAFLMDRIMKALGLHGRAFVPMLSGFACAVPAILATRTMERRRDRVLTMMVVPLMTCSARLPVYTLILAALFPPTRLFGFVPVQGLLMAAMYVFSTLTTLVVAFVLGRTLFKGPRIPLILELPPYRLPHLPSVVRMMWTRSRLFLTQAGTVILCCTVALWLLLTFPRASARAAEYETQRASARAALDGEPETSELARIDAEERGARLRESFGGRLGRAIEPTIAPLGFDWKIGIGLIGAFAAREVFVSTMGVVYGLGEDVDEGSTTLREKIRAETHANGEPVYTPLAGLSLMIFFALACQCMSTLAAVRRETGGLRWPAFLFAYMTALAWVASFVVYQGGRLLGLG